MNNQEIYKLFKNSRLAQVATPMTKTIRGATQPVPTHQLILTTTSNALRSNFGLKTALPKQVGFSGIEFNNIDNARKMPDVEKSSGYKFNRLRFQESELVLKKAYNRPNPLFALPESKTVLSLKAGLPDTAVSKFNMGNDASLSEVKALLKRNPEIRRLFREWLLENSPESVMLKIPSKLDQLLKDFLASSPLVRKQFGISDLIKSDTSSKSTIQGSAGLSYLQRGRLTNSPNGVKSGFIAPGRLVKGNREAAIGGFVAGVNERTLQLQSNYINNAPGKHSRQFVLPFKVVEAELTPKGAVRMFADGVRVGDWMRNSDVGSSRNYTPSNPNFNSMSERNQQDTNALEALLGLVSRPRN